ncbi:unnamed protein product, partial [Prorocentrum cordatum]
RASALQISAEPWQTSPRPQPRAELAWALGGAVAQRGAAGGALRCSEPLALTSPSAGLGATVLPTGALGGGRSAFEGGAGEAAAGPRRGARARAREGPRAATAAPAWPNRAAAKAARAGWRNAALATAPASVARAARQRRIKTNSVSAKTSGVDGRWRERVARLHGPPPPRDQAKLDPIFGARLAGLRFGSAFDQRRPVRALQGLRVEGPELPRDPRPRIAFALVAEQIAKGGRDGVAAARAAVVLQFDDAATLRDLIFIDAGRTYPLKLMETLLAEAASGNSSRLFPSLPFAMLEKLLRGAAAAAEHDHAKLTPRMLRRGGPSEGAPAGRRSLAQVQERGRWEAKASVR